MILNPGKTEFSAAEHAELRRKVEGIKTFDGLTEAQIGREAEISPSTLNQYLKGKYQGQNDPVAVALQRWIDARQVASEQRGRLPVAPSFQPLGMSKMILMRIQHARALGRMAMIAGVPGVSKTATARQYKADNPRTYLATMDPATRGVPTMLMELLRAMGIENTAGTPQTLAKRALEKATEAESVILIDEAQHLSEPAIEQLRAINDKSREIGKPVGIVLLGNEAAYAKIGPTGTKAAFAQVSSRIAQRKYITEPTRDDVAAVAHAWADANRETLTAPMVDFLVSIAMRPGGLRNVEMTFESALLAAFGAEEPLNLNHLKGAFGAVTDLGRAA